MNELADRIRNLTPERRAIFEHKLKEKGLHNSIETLTGGKQSEAYGTSLENTPNEPIAIIGMSCRFPGGGDPDEFWNTLHSGVDCITEIPGDRWDVNAFYDPDPTVTGKMNTRWGGFINNIAEFSPSFFRITPYEAERIDPQQRLLMEVTWEALESAGYASERLRGSQTGVFIGISTNDYLDLQFSDPKYVDGYAGTGNSRSIAANRLSYIFDLRGPSFIVDTACSSSIVALHTACSSLREGDCDMAIVGGVNLILSPETMMTFSQARMLSPDGRCKTFDASANGYVRGEGAGVVILKRLSQALASHDNVLAKVRSTALNQDGMSNGLTAPNGRAQQRVIRAALRKAGLKPNEVGYIEAHGTGTPLGDPIEVQALHEVLGEERDKSQRCYLGSVKTNIGHTEAAAGIASLIKAVLCFQNDEIPPHLHFRKLNPKLDKSCDIFDIPTEPVFWPRTHKPRIIGINSFSFGGANAHAVLEEPPVTITKPASRDRDRHLFTLSARTDSALKALAQRYVDYMENNKDLVLADFCFSANAGRCSHEKRLALCVETMHQARDDIKKYLDGDPGERLSHGELSNKGRKKIAFLFTGQGSQYPDMGKGLYESHAGFRRSMDRCTEIARPLIGFGLLDHIYPKDRNHTRLNETTITQPALFAVEYSLARLWMSWGVEPDAVLGHSLGEYVAACISGVFTLEQALQLVTTRARLMGSLPSGGAMAAVMASEDKIEPILAGCSGQVTIAAYNGPKLITLSGDQNALEGILGALDVEGVNYQRLPVSHAFHSPLMRPMVRDFEAELGRISYGIPQVPLVSNVTGGWLKTEECCAEYWVRHALSPVRYSQSIEFIYQQGCELFLEVGPKATLSGMARDLLPKSAVLVPSLKPVDSVWEALMSSLGRLYVNGVNPDWIEFDREYSRYRLPLPTYSFERQRCWLDEIENARKNESAIDHRSTNSKSAGRYHSPSSPLLEGAETVTSGTAIEVKKQFRFDDNIVKDHCVSAVSIVPAAAHMEMAMEVASQYAGRAISELRNVAIVTPVSVSEGSKNEVIIALDTANIESGAANFRIYSPSFGSTDEAESDPQVMAIPDGESYRLETTVPGSIDSLFLKPTQKKRLDQDEVEIEVRAAGLNFMDLMNVLGLLPTDSASSVPLGTECAGKIVRVGEAVRDIRVGDEVIASTLHTASFSRYAVTKDALVVPKPAHLTFEEAASIPTVFLTAYYSLVHLARLKKGERVLIHSASGGVGLAAIQIAQHIGAEVFTTAGSEERRNYLRTLGINHIMNSRTDEFVREIMGKTDGKGVDVILNSLSGEFIEKSMSVLAPYGRFVEIGKTDIYNNSKIDLYPFRNNLSYFAVDLHKLAQQRPEYARGIFEELAEYFATTTYRPGHIKQYSITKAQEAFRFMAQRKHIGKIVLTMHDMHKPKVHTSGFVSLYTHDEEPGFINVDAIRARCRNTADAREVYEAFRKIGIDYGPYYRTIRTIRTNVDEGLAQFESQSDSKKETPYQVPLSILDGALQSLGALFFYSGMGKYMYVPFTIDRLRIYGPIPSKVYCYVKATDYAGPTNDSIEQRTGFAQVCDENGTVLIELEGVSIRRIPLNHRAIGDEDTSSIKGIEQVIGSSSEDKSIGIHISCDTAKPVEEHGVRPNGSVSGRGASCFDYEKSEGDLKSRIKRLLTEKVAKYLRQDSNEISPDVSLISIGLESLMAVDIIGQMNETLGLTLDPTSMFEYSTINQLTEHVYREQGDQLEPGVGAFSHDKQSDCSDSIEYPPEGGRLASSTFTYENETMEDWLEKRVKEKIARYLKQEPADISPQENLINLGLESLMAVDIISQFNDELGLALEPASMFEHPTVEELVQLVISENAELIQERRTDRRDEKLTGNTDIDQAGNETKKTYARQLQMESEDDIAKGYDANLSVAKQRAKRRHQHQYVKSRIN